jgi:hypothetical protein
MTRPDQLDYRKQVITFGKLYESVESLLECFGSSKNDYAVHSDYVGYPQVVVFVENLKMLCPNIVSALQELVKGYRGWQIELTVAVPGHDKDWPDMGVYVRPNEIVDALQRQYFPKEFRSIEYEGARRGAAFD